MVKPFRFVTLSWFCELLLFPKHTRGTFVFENVIHGYTTSSNLSVSRTFVRDRTFGIQNSRIQRRFVVAAKKHRPSDRSMWVWWWFLHEAISFFVLFHSFHRPMQYGMSCCVFRIEIPTRSLNCVCPCESWACCVIIAETPDSVKSSDWASRRWWFWHRQSHFAAFVSSLNFLHLDNDNHGWGKAPQDQQGEYFWLRGIWMPTKSLTNDILLLFFFDMAIVSLFLTYLLTWWWWLYYYYIIDFLTPPTRSAWRLGQTLERGSAYHTSWSQIPLYQSSWPLL
jgi:hypothetical protein